MPRAKALVALQRSILIIIFHLLADPTAEFTDLGPDFYTAPRWIKWVWPGVAS